MHRDSKYDNIKFLLMLGVVFSHLARKYVGDSFMVARVQYFGSLFLMPSFVFISGLFSKKTINERKIYKAVPFLFLCVFMQVIYYIASCVVKGIDEVGAFAVFTENGTPWFGFAMFWWMIITMLIKNKYPIYSITAIFLLAVLAGYCKDIAGLLALRRTAYFYPFYYIGYLTDIEKFNTMMKKTRVKVASGILLAVVLAVIFTKYAQISVFRTVFRGSTSYFGLSARLSRGWAWLYRMIAYCVSIVVMVSVMSLIPGKKSVFSYWGKRTLPVYAIHYVAVYIIHNISGLEAWLSSSHIFTKSALLSFALLVVCALPIFDWPLKKMMTPDSWPKTLKRKETE